MKRSVADYDAMIERYEQQLKTWKAKRRQLRTAEARRAEQEARQQELVRLEQEVKSYHDWMFFTFLKGDTEFSNLFEFYEATKDDGGIRIISVSYESPEDGDGANPPPLGEHQGAQATQPGAEAQG